MKNPSFENSLEKKIARSFLLATQSFLLNRKKNLILILILFLIVILLIFNSCFVCFLFYFICVCVCVWMSFCLVHFSIFL